MKTTNIFEHEVVRSAARGTRRLTLIVRLLLDMFITHNPSDRIGTAETVCDKSFVSLRKENSRGTFKRIRTSWVLWWLDTFPGLFIVNK